MLEKPYTAFWNVDVDDEQVASSDQISCLDSFVYDWWSLFAGWAEGSDVDENPAREPSNQAKWVYELMTEEQVKALPRSMEALGRCYDSREFWSTFSIAPLKARI